MVLGIILGEGLIIKMKKILLITGQAGSGKTTLANRLMEKMDAEKESFAKILKTITFSILKSSLCKDVDYNVNDLVYGTDDQKSTTLRIDLDCPKRILMVKSIWMTFILDYDIDYELFEPTVNILLDCLKSKDVTSRKIMQIIGTEIIRDHISVKFHTEMLINRIRFNDNDTFIIDDYRFPNEYDLLKDVEEFTVKAIHLDCISENVHTHRSETEDLFSDVRFTLERGTYLDEKYDPVIISLLEDDNE